MSFLFFYKRVFFLDIPNDSIIERTTLRYLDPVTGERYHMLFNPPPTQEIRDRLVQKESESEQQMRQKINEYYANVRDLLDYFEQNSVHINADQDPNTVFESIESNIINALPNAQLEITEVNE
jgi:adenylate kinase